jgi:Holliday junction DNA helicase RuvA
MIASLNGRVLESGADSLVIGIGGVGLLVYVPMPVRERVRVGDEVQLYTYLVVREDSLTLYGFESQEERGLFELLLGVNGVGPRLALAVLSALTADAIRRAIVHEQPEVFNRVSGVGKKTSQKILLHLQDKIPAVSGIEAATVMTDVDAEVISALTALGYSVVEAQAALQSVPRDAPDDVEERLRLALQYFM